MFLVKKKIDEIIGGNHISIPLVGLLSFIYLNETECTSVVQGVCDI